MIKSITYNLKNLLNFKGRDTRSIFWRYFLFIVLVNMGILVATTAPAFIAIIGEIAAGVNDAAGDTAALEAAALEKMIAVGLPATMIKAGLSVAALNIILLAASFVRRAHDSGLPGMLLVIPTSLQLIWMYFSYSQLDGIEDTMRAAATLKQANEATPVQLGMIAQDLLGWLVVLMVIVIGLVKTQKSANQYGDPPGL